VDVNQHIAREIFRSKHFSNVSGCLRRKRILLLKTIEFAFSKVFDFTKAGE
jgi:hypothetical protein